MPLGIRVSEETGRLTVRYDVATDLCVAGWRYKARVGVGPEPRKEVVEQSLDAGYREFGKAHEAPVAEVTKQGTTTLRRVAFSDLVSRTGRLY